MLIQKGSREDAIHALINTWLKDPRMYCGWCGEDFDITGYQCCDQPFISNNNGIFKQFVKELQMDRDQMKNKHGSMKGSHMRWALKFPPGLLIFLERSFEQMYNEKLFTKEYDITWFSKKFYKYFAVPKEI